MGFLREGAAEGIVFMLFHDVGFRVLNSAGINWFVCVVSITLSNTIRSTNRFPQDAR